MRSQLRRIGGIQVTGRNDYIGIYIIAVFEYGSFCIFHFSNLLCLLYSWQGQEIFPVTALAAATAGLAR